MATLVREAIDLAYPDDADAKRRAAERILAAEPMEVPPVEEFLRELDELRGSRF